MEHLQAYNRKLLANILPVHVAEHFMSMDKHTDVSLRYLISIIIIVVAPSSGQSGNCVLTSSGQSVNCACVSVAPPSGQSGDFVFLTGCVVASSVLIFACFFVF